MVFVYPCYEGTHEKLKLRDRGDKIGKLLNPDDFWLRTIEPTGISAYLNSLSKKTQKLLQQYAYDAIWDFSNQGIGGESLQRIEKYIKEHKPPLRFFALRFSGCIHVDIVKNAEIICNLCTLPDCGPRFVEFDCRDETIITKLIEDSQLFPDKMLSSLVLYPYGCIFPPRFKKTARGRLLFDAHVNYYRVFLKTFNESEYMLECFYNNHFKRQKPPPWWDCTCRDGKLIPPDDRDFDSDEEVGKVE